MFDTHKLNDEGFAAMEQYKQTMADAVKQATSLMLDGREKAIFITKMEEGVFFGAKAIASRPGNHTEIKTY